MIVFFIGSVTSVAWYCCKTDRITSSESQRSGGRSLSGMNRVTMLYAIFVQGFFTFHSLKLEFPRSWHLSDVHKDKFPYFLNVQVGE